VFEKTKSYIGKVVSKIFPEESKKEKIEDATSKIMKDSIKLWSDMYEDKAKWLKDEELESYNLASSIASEIARLVTIEMISEVTGKTDEEGKGINNKRAEFLNDQYQNVIDDIRIETEYAAAKGGMVFKPYVENEKIYIDYVQADNFVPIKFNGSGDLIAATFPDTIIKNNKTYTREEYHELMPNGIYYISNESFVDGKPCELTDLEEWEDLEAELNIKGLEKPLFSYFKMPLANNKDCNSNLGVSVYSKAVDIIKQVDKQYNKILWEYEGTELAIDVSLDMLKNGEMPEGKKRIFRKLDVDTKDDSFYEVFSPEIRDESLYNGLNKLLQAVEYRVGLAYGTISDMQVVEKTATEIASSKQRSYSTVVDIQKALRVALEHLLYAMDWYTTYYKLAPEGDYEVSFDFDDSIVVNVKEEQMIMLNEVNSGLIKPEYYLQKRYGLSEQQAKDMLPNMNDNNNPDDGIE